MAVKGDLGGGAETSAKLFVLGEFGRNRGIGNGEVVAVAASHAQRPIGARKRSVGSGRNASAEQVLEEAARTGGDVLAIFRGAIGLPERPENAAAVCFAFAAVALPPPHVIERAGQICADLRELVFSR